VIADDASINRLRFALYRYGDHIHPCPRRPCTCGFLDEWQYAELPTTFRDVAFIEALKPMPVLPGSISK
jgi:hypothetical protein